MIYFYYFNIKIFFFFFFLIILEKTKTICAIKELIQKIPFNHQKVLLYLLKLLRNVSKYSEENLMTVQNIATVFGPNVLRPRENSPESASLVGATTTINSVMELLISDQDMIFGVKRKAPLPPKRMNAPSMGSIPTPAPQPNAFVPGKSPRRAVSVNRGLLSRNGSTMGLKSQNQNTNPKNEKESELTLESLYEII